MRNCKKTPIVFFGYLSKFLMAVIINFVIISTIFTGCSTQLSQNNQISEQEFFLNTIITITLYDTDDTSLIDKSFELCEKYERIFSRTDENSELYKLNEQNEAQVSDELLHVLQTAIYYSELSEGKFDITMGAISDMYGFSSENPAAPDQDALNEALAHAGYKNIVIDGNYVKITDPDTVIDLGGIAKGYIGDKIKEFLVSQGVTSGIINLGGNVLCIGGKPDGSDFRVGIQYPFGDATETIAKLDVSDLCVVTSGVYERCFYENDKLYHHILDPKTGLPCDNGLLSVTIIGENSEICDALSTTTFAMGLDSIDLINQTDGVYALYVTDDYEVIYSEGLEKYIVED